MSGGWQDHIVRPGNVDKGAVVSTAGDTWATSPDWQISKEEGVTISALLAANGDQNHPAVIKAFSEGIYAAGERYVAFRVEDKHIFGRKGKTGIAIYKTALAFVIGHHGEDTVFSKASKDVEYIAQNLIDKKY